MLMEMIDRTVTESALTRFTASLFIAAGVPDSDADLIARVVVWSNLRGVDSHGVLRVPGYLARLENGINNPTPEFTIPTDLPAAAVLEADRAFGQVALGRASAIAIDKASTAGIGLCLVRRSTHMGAIGYFALEAAAEGMAGIVINVSRPNMAYPGARSAGLATSPIAIAVPGAAHAPLMLDMATATKSMGKIQLARDTGEPLGEGWAVDADGNPTTDPQKAVIPTALGGHKGGGLSLMFECLTSLMVGNPLIAPFIEGAPDGRRHSQNGLVIAIDISKFGDVGPRGRPAGHRGQNTPARRRGGRDPGTGGTRRPGAGHKTRERDTAARGDVETPGGGREAARRGDAGNDLARRKRPLENQTALREVPVPLIDSRCAGHDTGAEESRCRCIGQEFCRCRYFIGGRDRHHRRYPRPFGHLRQIGTARGVARLTTGLSVLAVIDADDGQIVGHHGCNRRQHTGIHKQFTVAGHHGNLPIGC